MRGHGTGRAGSLIIQMQMYYAEHTGRMGNRRPGGGWGLEREAPGGGVWRGGGAQRSNATAVGHRCRRRQAAHATDGASGGMERGRAGAL